MKSLFRIVVLISLISSGSAFAGDDCRRAMADWQSREAVSNYVTELGLESERLRIDDGCYEVRARDSQGNRVKLKIDPATLDILQLEVRFQPGNETSRYLPVPSGHKGKPAGPSKDQTPGMTVPSSPGSGR